MPNRFEHREAWLHAAIAVMQSLFGEHGGNIPANIRVASGFPFGSRKAIGQCWPKTASKDGIYEIFISPVLDDPMRVAGVLAHELVHATVGQRRDIRGRLNSSRWQSDLRGR